MYDLIVGWNMQLLLCMQIDTYNPVYTMDNNGIQSNRIDNVFLMNYTSAWLIIRVLRKPLTTMVQLLLWLTVTIMIAIYGTCACSRNSQLAMHNIMSKQCTSVIIIMLCVFFESVWGGI